MATEDELPSKRKRSAPIKLLITSSGESDEEHGPHQKVTKNKKSHRISLEDLPPFPKAVASTSVSLAANFPTLTKARVLDSGESHSYQSLPITSSSDSIAEPQLCEKSDSLFRKRHKALGQNGHDLSGCVIVNSYDYAF